MAHHHNHAAGVTGRTLYWCLAATLAFTFLEIVAGFRSGSLALLSDAGHNFTDALALLLAAIGIVLGGKPASATKTFGYGRAGVIAAFLNAWTLVLLSAFLVYEAIVRMLHPQPVTETVMLWVAVLALILNGGILLGLRASQRTDLNIRAAFIHMLGDALGAVAIIVGAIVIRLTGWTLIDPLLSIALAVLIIYTGWDIIKESSNILLEGLPRGLDLHQIMTAVSAVEGVLDVHDCHVWSLASHTHALSTHVLIEDMPPSASEGILKRINDVLCTFNIHHTTVQFEHVLCIVSDRGCQMQTVGTAAHEHGDVHHHHNH